VDTLEENEDLKLANEILTAEGKVWKINNQQNADKS